MTRRAQVELAAIRRLRGRTQQELAESAGWQQEAVSRLERRLGAAKLATLKRYVESLGGELRLLAVFRGEQLETQKRFKARIREGGQEAPGEMVVVRCGEGEGSAACSRPERQQWADGCTARAGQ